MAVDKRLRGTFDKVAELYDEARPGYPEAMVEDVITFSRIPAGGRILEVGCGPGKATLPFANRGYAILALELGEALANLAAAHCQPYPHVQIEHTSFEAWPLHARAFDLVICAQAFHWLDPEVRLTKMAASLRDGGVLALFWNDHRAGNAEFSSAVRQVYVTEAPELLVSRRSDEELVRRTVQEIDSSGLFGPVKASSYSWAVTHSTEMYIKGISTYSRIQGLDVETRKHLLEGIRSVIEQSGGEVESHYVSRLCQARVKR
jgi:SAM-dependent methyltransferase